MTGTIRQLIITLCCLLLPAGCMPQFTQPLTPALAEPQLKETSFISFDGTELPLNIAAPSVRQASDARATSLAGTWFAPLEPFRGFTRSTATWPLSDAGRAAMAAWTPAQASYADCIPVTAPTLMISRSA